MHIDNLIFLLLVAMAALFRFLISKAGSAGKSEPPETTTPAPRSNRPVAQPSANTDEERIRRFLEALGQPTSSKPPPPVTPRPAYKRPPVLPRLPTVRSPLPPLTTRPPDLPQQLDVPQPRAEPVFEVQERSGRVEPPPLTTTASATARTTEPQIHTPNDKIDIVALLGSPAGLRNAIILREIFGPPRSLQQIDFAGTG